MNVMLNPAFRQKKRHINVADRGWLAHASDRSLMLTPTSRRALRSFVAGLFALAMALLSAQPARAIVGGAPAAADMARHVVMIVSDRGSFCSASVIASDLLLTAGHCVRKGANYRLLTYQAGKPVLSQLGSVAIHPQFDAKAYDRRHFTIDLALVKLDAPLAGYAPLPLVAEAGIAGGVYRVAGFGLTAQNAGKSGGVLREIALEGAPPISKVQLRLRESSGVGGACQGDSGGPVLREGMLVGVLASAVGANSGRGCGGMTGVALLGTALPWIRSNAARMGASLP
ncbi:trypsin-like serine protease [Labrys sp. LIt4]|uniref:Peptidase S1 n=1 Tax=Labrys okinawensis TaxID=346911 RepID=A0A2S9QFF4_9HYPH|nr:MULTISPECIES: trypsin-like serine protease [Labrys]MBP0578279.1 trypsin-like serine protease [Labrys sp. LIt4]PRH88079.1 peptidase S1 [Labrys okinawensis]